MQISRRQSEKNENGAIWGVDNKSYLLCDFRGNRDYPGKSLQLNGNSFFSLKVKTYLDTAATTFPKTRIAKK